MLSPAALVAALSLVAAVGASPAPAPAPVAPTLSAEEMKQKRKAVGGDKKKEKVLGTKGATKSAKDEVVGKKAKRL